VSGEQRSLKKLQLEFFFRAAKIMSVLSTIWFFWWAVIWQVIWWQPPFSQSSNYSFSLVNLSGFVLSLLWWIIMDLLLAHLEVWEHLAYPKWHRKAAPKTTEKKEDERQPIY
jgi:hypothetical protein